MGANNKIKIQLNVRGHSHLFIYFYFKKKKVFTFNSLSVYNYSGSDVCTFSNPTPQNLWTPYHRFHLLVLVAMLKGSSCSEKGPDPISQSRHRARAGLYELTAKGGLKTDKAREGKKKNNPFPETASSCSSRTTCLFLSYTQLQRLQHFCCDYIAKVHVIHQSKPQGLLKTSDLHFHLQYRAKISLWWQIRMHFFQVELLRTSTTLLAIWKELLQLLCTPPFKTGKRNIINCKVNSQNTPSHPFLHPALNNALGLTKKSGF